MVARQEEMKILSTWTVEERKLSTDEHDNVHQKKPEIVQHITDVYDNCSQTTETPSHQPSESFQRTKLD